MDKKTSNIEKIKMFKKIKETLVEEYNNYTKASVQSLTEADLKACKSLEETIKKTDLMISQLSANLIVPFFNKANFKDNQNIEKANIVKYIDRGSYE